MKIDSTHLNRRQMLRQTALLSSLAFAPFPVRALGEEKEDGTLIPFLDVQPPGKGLRWENLESWITDNKDVFAVQHYGTPEVNAEKWQLEISGLVKNARTLSLGQLKQRPRKSVIATLECSGNSSNPGFMGAVANVKWTGTPLAPLLRECSPLKRGIETVFFGADEKVEKIREKDYSQNFARSLGMADAMRDDILLAYEMNGEPLPKEHGGPVRLVVPGWFGIAWIKWLSRIEVLDRRYMSKYMGREYVTIRGEEKEGKTIWRETSVGPIDIKSMIARAVRLKDGAVRLTGAAWNDGTPFNRVELKIDNEPWTAVTLDRKNRAAFGWTFWSHVWKKPQPGDHTLVSRALDTQGRIQPGPEDPEIKLKRTYWEANQQHPRKIRIA